MGTQERKTREKEARRQLILTAANRMLSEKGFMQMTMEDVAREAELSTGLLYFYFKGKDEILVTLLLNSIQYLNDRLRQVRDQDGVALQEKMKQLEDTFKDLLAFDPSVFHKIIHLHSSRNMEKLSFSLIEEVKEGYRQAFSLMTEIFRKIQDAGIAFSAAPDHYTDFICSIFLGSICHAQCLFLSAGDRDHQQQLLGEAFEIIDKSVSNGASQKDRKKICNYSA